MAVEALYEKACEAVERGNYDYAIELLREALRAGPDNVDARVALRGSERRLVQKRGDSFLRRIGASVKGIPVLAKASMTLRNPTKRLERYEDYLMKCPNSVLALVGAAKAARAAGLLPAAVCILKDMLKTNPNHKTALRIVSDALRDQNEPGEALKYLFRLGQLEPRNRDLALEIKNLEALDHMTTHKMEDAESFRDLIRDKEFADKSAAGEQKQAAEAAKHLPEFIKEAQQDLEADPDNPAKIIRLANHYVKDRDYKTAQDVLRDSVKRMPDNFTLRERLGDLQFQVVDLVIRKRRKELEENPDKKTELEQELQEILQRRREFAVQEYTWRAQAHPTDRNVRFNLGKALYEVEDCNGAIAQFQQACADPHLEPDAARMLGFCFAKKNQHDLAIEQYQRALKHSPEMDEKGKELHYLLAQAYESLGSKEKALSLYKKIYSADINYSDVAGKVDSLSS